LELAAERARVEARRALLIGELNHRVKNTLAVVQSLAAQTARGAPDLPAFASAFQARLLALARAHDLLTARGWEPAGLGDVVRAALAPWMPEGGEGGRVSLALQDGGGGAGPAAAVSPRQAQALVLALHELATNAAKHGALSRPGGRVEVRCAAGADGALAVEWAEAGGPPVAGPPARRGFGTRLLERGLARDLGPDKIRLNIITPGWIMTQRQIDLWLTPEAEVDLMKAQCLKEKVYPPDIARMVLWLAADDSRLVTAQNFVVDGGRM
jgi:two-component sensor histidine kinase